MYDTASNGQWLSKYRQWNYFFYFRGTSILKYYLTFIFILYSREVYKVLRDYYVNIYVNNIIYLKRESLEFALK